MEKRFFVYMMTNQYNTVLYTGITNNIMRRVYEHKNKLVKGFTSRYNINKLVYVEEYHDSYTAISREKQIKGMSREAKNKLIAQQNASRDDLYSL